MGKWTHTAKAVRFRNGAEPSGKIIIIIIILCLYNSRYRGVGDQRLRATDETSNENPKFKEEKGTQDQGLEASGQMQETSG